MNVNGSFKQNLLIFGKFFFRIKSATAVLKLLEPTMNWFKAFAVLLVALLNFVGKFKKRFIKNYLFEQTWNILILASAPKLRQQIGLPASSPDVNPYNDRSNSNPNPSPRAQKDDVSVFFVRYS
jgi:hypothetical protein